MLPQPLTWNDRDWAGFSQVLGSLRHLGGQHDDASQTTSHPLVDRARSQYASRRARDRIFADNAELFNEPVWDILLDLFIARHEGRRVSISSACIAACVSQTTALRRLNDLQRRGLIERASDVGDSRRHYVSLTDAATELVTRALQHP